MNIKNKKIIVALSGGVDSSVCACLLKQQYSNIQAVYMRNWDSAINQDFLGNKNFSYGCNDKQDYKHVKEICDILNIPLKIYNFVEEYWEYVFEPSLNIFKTGNTPNPDVVCNQKIKFGILLKKIIADFGNDVQIATGHYAGIEFKNKSYFLKTAANDIKDQTYFLHQLNQNQLKYIQFPLSEINDKKIVRQIAKNFNLPTWNKKDSVGICFIGKRKHYEFLSNYINFTPGKIIDITTKKILGEHQGLSFYTIGQRKGISLSGLVEPMYVCKKDITKNILFVCTNSEKLKYLYTTTTKINHMHWINLIKKINDQILMRIRHTGQLIEAKIIKIENEKIILTHKKIITTAPGQYVVIYSLDKKYCLGGGILVN